MAGVSGVRRCFLPLPVHETLAPTPRVTSQRRSPHSSETRRPVWMASTSRAWSRRPRRVPRSGAATSVDLGTSEVGDVGPTGALGADGKDALDEPGVLGMAQRGEPKERVDRGQPGFAGANGNASVGLEVVEKRADERSVEALEAELGRRCPGGRLDEAPLHQQRLG